MSCSLGDAGTAGGPTAKPPLPRPSVGSPPGWRGAGSACSGRAPCGCNIPRRSGAWAVNTHTCTVSDTLRLRGLGLDPRGRHSRGSADPSPPHEAAPHSVTCFVVPFFPCGCLPPSRNAARPGGCQDAGDRGLPHALRTQGSPLLWFSLPPQSCPRKGQSQTGEKPPASPPPRAGGPQEGSDSSCL